MACAQRCKQEFRCSNFGLEYHDPSHFTRFEWGWPKVYLIWRGVMAAYHVAMLVLTGFLGTETWTRTQADKVKWFVYLTHWMFFILTLCTVLEFLAVLYTNLARRDIIHGNAVSMPLHLKVTWVMQNAANNISILVTALFWGLLYSPSYPLTDMDIITHAGNTVYVLINFFITASPVRFYHFIHTFITALVFIVFSVIYQVAGGTNGLGHNYIYSVLDWTRTPGTAALYACLCTIVAVPVLQGLLLLLYWLRVMMYDTCLTNRNTVDVDTGNEKK